MYKRCRRKIPGGVFGREGELKLFASVDLPEERQVEEIRRSVSTHNSDIYIYRTADCVRSTICLSFPSTIGHIFGLSLLTKSPISLFEFWPYPFDDESAFSSIFERRI